jgi:uncharacterized membrane protein YdbT with pleckstrin-like domain
LILIDIELSRVDPASLGSESIIAITTALVVVIDITVVFDIEVENITATCPELSEWCGVAVGVWLVWVS